jgi:PhnB protein
MSVKSQPDGYHSVTPYLLVDGAAAAIAFYRAAFGRYPTALAAGATAMRPVVDQFYGDRSGTLRDPFGHIWTIATHIEDLTPQQIGERLAAMGAQADG